MRYDVTLRIEHDYAAPSAGVHLIARLLPLTIPHEQRLVSGAVSVTPTPAERRDRTDFFGNATAEIAWRTPIDAVRLVLRARIEREARPPELDLSPKIGRLAEEMAEIARLDGLAPHHFLAASDRVAPTPEMTAYARVAAPADLTAMETVQAVGRALHRDLDFDAGATDVDTAPAEAFAKRHGVCQDFTHIMIACLRGLRIPAGYVSGFLRTIPPEGQPRLEGADAMHAWVMAWCGLEVGWVQFDPTNDLMVGGDHVVVAKGRDYADIAPVKGVLRTSGRQKIAQAVDMVPLET